MPPVTPVSAVQRSSQRISGFSEEDDLDTVWSKILIRCNKITSWNLNDQTATLTVEAVIAKINPPKDSKKDSKDVAKKVFQNALVCVQRFGQIAANATSMVFGPSQNCFNAISFVISAVQEYDAVFASITALMERVSVFLEKLRIYLDDEGAETKLDKRLRKTVYRVLEHFLVIMGLAHKLTHGWKGRVKLAAKIGAFGEDPQVKDAMAKLETLIADETRTEITVIVKDLSEAARNIRGVDRKLDVITEEVEKIGSSLNVLQADAEGRKVEVDHRKRLETLSEAINLNASKKPWKDRQEELSAKAIPGTGQWLLEYQAATISFPRWADPQASDLNVLNVKADEGFGKSYLCSTVIRHLQDMHRDNSKVCIAYYYFQRDASEKNPINKAMKSIIWQLASGNTSLSKEYLRLAVRACDGKSDFSRTAELWQRLVSETAKHLEATVFIILDGIDEVESEPGKPLAGILRQVRDLEQDAQMRIRVLLTGRPTGLDALKDDVGGYLPEIDIAAPGRQSSLNEEDILAYAQYRLDNMTTFHSKDEKMIERVQDLKERAKRELAAGVYGDFLALDYKLDDLANLRNFGQVQEVLDRAKEGRSEAIARKVEQLNEILSKDEIEEVNELIMWTTTAYTDLSLHQYDLILRLKTGVQTLISLEKQVTEKYRSIFAVDEGYVALRSEDIREHLYSSAKMPEEDGTLQIGQQKSAPLQEGEVALVRKILKTHFRNVFGEEDVYRRFAFDAFFDSKLGDRKVQIYLTSVDGSHVRLAQACLVVVCDKLADEDFRPLHNYAFGWLARHLREVNLENVGDSFKEDTGRKLARLLTDTTIIDAWWTADRMYQAVDWVFDDFYTFAVHRWFEDPVVLNGLRDMPKERQWITDVLDNEGPVTRILVHIAKRMAEHWFAKKLPLSLEAFKWLFGYHRQMVLLGKGRAITPEELLAISYHDLPWNSEKISVEDIVAVEKLAKESLLEEGDEAKWHHLMGTTLHEFEKYSSAIERYREALKHGQDDWMLRLGLARALNLSNLDRRQRETTEEVVAVLRSLMEYNELLLETDTEYRRRYWEDILFLLALQFTKLDKHTEAEETYKKIFQEGVDKNDFDDPSQRAALALFACLNWQEKHDEVIDFVEQLSARTHMLGNWLVALFDTSFDNTDLHGRVISSANHAGRLGTIIKLYQDIVDAAKSEMPPRPTAFRIDISHWLASIMFSRRAQDQRRIALNLWNEIMDIGLADAVRDSFRISQILELASRKITFIA
ncbi:hypothetical protein HII31_06452 [Pseudocercospora fuligena]|uniref:Fungal STAND N-terminal Goodbye domain-containing protein n=1 Tax=Pseudocercospora fuligena TaxID=685502 RepID=A0A8H6RIG1_9PEZI|nr:hypothetical protein HII31_06452 [Pseudocercospora fuligena]